MRKGREMSDFEIGDDVDQIIERFDEMLFDDEMEQAREFIDAAIAAHPEEVKLRASKAELEIEEDNYEEGIAILDELLDQTEDDEELAVLLNLKSYASYYTGDLDVARRTFNRTLRHDPELWSALVGRATVHDRMGFLVAAMLDLDHAIEIDDQEADPFALRARIYMKRGAVDEAEKNFDYAIESNPYDEESRLQLARIRARKGNTVDAIELLEPVLDQGEDTDVVAVGALLRSQLSMMLGSTEAALEDAELSIENWPERPWGYLQKAACLLSAMNADEALKVLKEAERCVENVRDVPDISALRASAYEQLEKHDKAKRERNKVEGSARLPGIVYGPILNPAANVPINPDKPIDVRAILADLFGKADRAPNGYEDALRDIIDRLPEIISDNPNVERIQIELPQVPGMRGPARNLVIQVNQNQGGEQQAPA